MQERGKKVKGIWTKLVLVLAAGWMFFPLHAAAQEQDAVTLRQEESRVSVLLEVSNAENERITSVSLSLKLDSASKDKVTVDFDFAPGLADAAQGFHYNSGTGRMDIYAASAENLFSGNGENLHLGYVRVMPKDASQVLDIEISYCENSFQTANASYGDKTPMVEQEVDSVCMKIGAGVVYTASTQTLEDYLAQALNSSRESYSEEAWADLQSAIQEAQELLQKGGLSQSEIDDMAERLYLMMANREVTPPAGENNAAPSGGNSGTGNTSSGNGAGNSQKGDGNQKEGLYDESTRFVNDPANAQNISSSVIGNKDLHSDLVDMSQGAAAVIGGRPKAGGSGGSTDGETKTAGEIKAAGRVSVVDPADGPAGILVAGREGWKMSGGEGIAALTPEEGNGSEEILLDQKNGGAVDENKKNERNLPLIIGVAAAVVIAVAAMVAVALAAKRKRAGTGKKKKRRPKKKKK